MIRVIGLLLLVSSWQLQAVSLSAAGKAARTTKRMISRNADGSERLRGLLERLHSMRSKTLLSTRSNADANNLWDTPIEQVGMPTIELDMPTNGWDPPNNFGRWNYWDDHHETGVGGNFLGGRDDYLQEIKRDNNVDDLLLLAAGAVALGGVTLLKKDKGKKDESKKDESEEKDSAN